MKRIIHIIVLVIMEFYAQAQDSPSTESVIVYKFEQFSVNVASQSTTDSLLSQPGNQQQSSSTLRILSIQGPMVKIFVTSGKEPFPYPVQEVSFDDRTSHYRRIEIDDLEMRSGIVNIHKYTDWTDVIDLPELNSGLPIHLFQFIPGNLRVTKRDSYVLFERGVNAYSKRIVSIRNKRTKKDVLSIILSVVDSPIYPFLELALRSAADKKLIDSLLERSSQTIDIPITELSQKGLKFPDKSVATSKLLREENLYETSELVLYFKKQRSPYPDSSLEYRLSSETDKDTNWIKTGHKLIISDLAAGNHYKLQVRYELHPAFIQEHTFYVVPKWYERKQSKIIFIGLLIFVALFAWLLIYNSLLKKSKRRREQLSLEIKSIRSQLNPHFIFNALSSIQSLMNKNNIPSANRYLTDFSTLLRESLRNNDQEMVPLVTEINLLEIYLKLEQLRFNFRYEINVDESINKNATEIPNLLLQPLVENAVKHGVSTLSDEGPVIIAFVKRDNNLLVQIIDNGARYDETNSLEGFGLKLTRSRIALLNQTLNEQPIHLTLARVHDTKTIVNLVFTNWI